MDEALYIIPPFLLVYFVVCYAYTSFNFDNFFISCTLRYWMIAFNNNRLFSLNQSYTIDNRAYGLEMAKKFPNSDKTLMMSHHILCVAPVA